MPMPAHTRAKRGPTSTPSRGNLARYAAAWASRGKPCGATSPRGKRGPVLAMAGARRGTEGHTVPATLAQRSHRRRGRAEGTDAARGGSPARREAGTGGGDRPGGRAAQAKSRTPSERSERRAPGRMPRGICCRPMEGGLAPRGGKPDASRRRGLAAKMNTGSEATTAEPGAAGAYAAALRNSGPEPPVAPNLSVAPWIWLQRCPLDRWCSRVHGSAQMLPPTPLRRYTKCGGRVAPANLLGLVHTG